MSTTARILAGSTATIMSFSLLIPIAVAAEATEIAGVEGTASWGIKESFTKYLTSPFAGGTIAATEGASWAAPIFNLPIDTDASTVTDNDTAVIDLDGAIHFSAHQGALDIALDDLKIHVDGSTGYLTADFSSLPLDVAKPVVSDDAVLVDITFPESIDFSQNSTITGTTVLAETGAPVFGNYDAGEAFDDITLDLAPILAEGDLGEELPSEAPAEPSEPSEPTEPSETGKSSSIEGSSNDNGVTGNKLVSFLSGLLGIGGIGMAIASIVKHFSHLVR